jgi:hypothetical protein
MRVWGVRENVIVAYRWRWYDLPILGRRKLLTIIGARCVLARRDGFSG